MRYSVFVWKVAVATAAIALSVDYSDMPPEHGLDTAGSPNDNADILRGSGVFVPKPKCSDVGGYCVTQRKDCDGLVDRRGCRGHIGGKKCKCCIPGPVAGNINAKLDYIIERLDLQNIAFPYTGGSAYASSAANDPMDAFLTGGVTWHSGEPTRPQSLWFEFPEPIRVVKYSFTSRDDQENRYTVTDGPSRYIFWASNTTGDCSDQSTWERLYEDNSGIPFSKYNQPKVESFYNTQYYYCYGFLVTNVPGRSNGDTWVTIGNVHYYSIQDHPIP